MNVYQSSDTVIYFSLTKSEAQHMDALSTLDQALGRDQVASFINCEYFDYDLAGLAGMIAKHGADYLADFDTRARQLWELNDDSHWSMWLELSNSLELELQSYRPTDLSGMRYYAHCQYCSARVIAETDQDLAGRVMGFYCGDCGRAFYTRVPGKAKQRARSDQLQEAILKILISDELPMTIRHIFYTLAGYGYVKKNDAGYDATLYQLGIMREAGQVPYTWLADNTRWHIRPRTYSDAEAALTNTAETYRRALWDTQPAYVEIWCEKDAIASIIASVTRPYDVPLFVARGFSSKTPLYNIAQDIRQIGKPAYIYHFGDFDPSGVKAFEAASKTLKAFCAKFGGRVELQRVAVTDQQIRDWNLPTRPTKKSTHSRDWGDKPSVELDVIPPSRLRELARACIEKHIDQGELNRIKRIEQEERGALETVLQNFRLAQNSTHDQGERGANET